MSNPTPGPWKTDYDLIEPRVQKIMGECYALPVFDALGDLVCYVAIPADAAEEDPEPAEANARLIAAAPELLEALVRLRDEEVSFHCARFPRESVQRDCANTGCDPCAYCAALTAIAKAEPVDPKAETRKLRRPEGGGR